MSRRVGSCPSVPARTLRFVPCSPVAAPRNAFSRNGLRLCQQQSCGPAQRVRPQLTCGPAQRLSRHSFAAAPSTFLRPRATCSPVAYLRPRATIALATSGGYLTGVLPLTPTFKLGNSDLHCALSVSNRAWCPAVYFMLCRSSKCITNINITSVRSENTRNSSRALGRSQAFPRPRKVRSPLGRTTPSWCRL